MGGFFEGRGVDSDDGKTKDANGDIDPKGPAPAGGEAKDNLRVGQPATEKRTDNRAETEDGPDKTLPTTTLTGREEVADDSEGVGHDDTAADTLEGAEVDELVDVLSGSAEERAESKDSHTNKEERATAVEIGDFTGDGDGDGAG